MKSSRLSRKKNVLSMAGLIFSQVLLSTIATLPVYAKEQAKLRSPEPGVLCDFSVCADSKGISRKLTEKHLGKKRAAKTFSQGDFDLTQFTFSNGIFCDSKEKLCRTHRYYGGKGQRSGPISKKYTKQLFGK